jgi:hypothetical protein
MNVCEVVMEKIRGKLIVEMKFAIPITADFYKAACNKPAEDIVADDIIQVEEQNYLADPDSYFEMLADNITEVSFDFQAMRGNVDV